MRTIRAEWWVAIAATCLSLVAVTLAYQARVITLYGDAMAHLLISRRVVDGVTTGLAQLGSYWLPLPHLLSLPLIMNDDLFYSGLAGAVFQMASFVLASIYLYRYMILLTNNAWSGAIAVLILVLNPSMLYMQSTSMTEVMAITTMLAGCYHFLAWSQKESPFQLALSAFWLFLAGLVRYEAWILTATLAVIMVYITWRKKFSFVKTEAHLIYWGSLAGLCVVLWVAWSFIIFGDPLDFHKGEYSNPELWVGMADPYIGNWRLSVLTFGYAMAHIMGWPLMALGAVGLVVFLLKERLNPKSIVSVALLGQIVFFILMLYGAQRPLLVPEVAGGMYNIRFALVTVVPIAIFVGYLASLHRRLSAWVLVLTLCAIAFSYQGGIILLDEAVQMDKDTPQPESAWFLEHYDYGLVLGENVGNERLFFNGRVPLGENIYEGSHIWDATLVNPMGHDVRWIIARHTPKADKVWGAILGPEADLGTRQQVEANYEVVFDDGRVLIFKLIGG